jgi:hypothetical protein
MKLIETVRTATAIRMRYTDNADPTKATQWLDFQVPLQKLEHANKVPMDPVTIEGQGLAEVSMAALRSAWGAIEDELKRLRKVIEERDRGR